jgi:pilus assembly protein CpaE
MQHSTGILVLRGDARLQLIESPLDPGQMSALIEQLATIWNGYIVINTSNGLDRWTVEILDSVDTVLLVTTPELPALRVMRGFLDLAEAEADPGHKWRLIMSSYQSQKVLRMVDIEESIHYPIKATMVADFELVPASINRGTPFVISHAKADVSKDVFALARQLLNPGPETQRLQAADNRQPSLDQQVPDQPSQSGRRGSFWQLFTFRTSEKLERSAG